LLKVNNQPAAFCALGHFPHPVRSYRKVHRLVVLPDYQGLGLGTLFIEELAKRSDKPFAITTSQPSLIWSLRKKDNWLLTRNTRNTRNTGKLAKKLNKTLSNKRITTTFVYKRDNYAKRG
jgi:GNAT superfamily N-acetyltransferase